MRRLRVLAAVSLVLIGWAGLAHAFPDPPPPGYALRLVSAGLELDEFKHVTQMAFKPGDPNHLYATRFNFVNWPDGGVVTRYDYDAATGMLSNPVDVATMIPTAAGLAFFGDDLIVSSTNLAAGVGSLLRLSDTTGDGLFDDRVAFVNNIPTGLHFVNQIQIQNNTLYVGLGTITDQGDPDVETVYNGTVGWITDLAQADFSADGANNLDLADVPTSTDPGRLRVFAEGFRNPFGIMVDDLGRVSLTDNGADDPVTEDLFYYALELGDIGIFPITRPDANTEPFAGLGFNTAGTGLDFIPFGEFEGQILVGLFASETSGHPIISGNEWLRIDPVTGEIAPFITNFGNPIDAVRDPFGRMLLADFGPNFLNNFDPDSGGIYLLIPEPNSGLLLVISASALGMVQLVRKRRRRSKPS